MKTLTCLLPFFLCFTTVAHAASLRERFNGKVTNERLNIHWQEDSRGLWYQNGSETIHVNTESGERTAGYIPDGKPAPKKKDKQRDQHFPDRQSKSPDGQSTLFLRDYNLFVKSADDTETQLTTDGVKSPAYRDNGYWSPDSNRVAVMRVREEQKHTVYMVESAPKDQVQPKLIEHQYLKPGDDIRQERPHLFDIESGKEIPTDNSLFANPWSINSVHWTKDSQNLRFVYNQRGHQVMRIINIAADTGVATAIVNEQSQTFIDYSQKQVIRFLSDTDEIIWSSEHDGWHHLYLYDANTGQVKNQITQGEWIVHSVENIDTEKREITFRAMGIFPDQDPYHVHFARIGFDRSNPVKLTDGDGTHSLEYSPDGETYVDTYSRVDLPPVHELRRTSDGKKIAELERADDSKLRAEGWRAPERFVAKGRDGLSDIHGIILRPTDCDPAKKYPVIEKIYAGPHGHFVPKSFFAYQPMLELVEEGFIMVQIDGMGTNFRSKAFHDVCWKNLKDSGFPDRILWLKATADKHPEFDLTRVGIYGGSAGGQSTLAGMLFHPDFYKVGVADCGCHDNRMDKIWWNEAWMGWPIDDAYADNSNVTHAAKLQGKLLLTVGELDRNVDPASTMQVVDALIKADKDFDMIVVPGANHGIGESPYMNRRRTQYFIEHLKP
jgi:dipeptidyl-peptidase-4